MATARKTPTTRTATETAQEKLTEALALVATRKAEHEQAEENREELTARLSGGDDTVTPLDLAAATFAIERAELLAGAARKRIKPAENALDSAQAIDNPSLARFIADRIEADPFAFGVFGLTVVVNADDRSKPGVYIGQSKATKTNPATGIMSGPVGITVVSPNGSPIDGAAMLAGLAGIESSGAALVSAQASPSASGVHVNVGLSNVKPDLPTLPAEVDGKVLRNFGYDLALSIAKKGGQYTLRGSGMHGGSGLYDMTVNNINPSLDDASVTKQERDGDQVRRTVRVVFDLSSKKFHADQISEYTRASVGNLVSEFAAGVGRVKAARVISERAATEDPKPGQEFRNASKTDVRVTVEVDAVARIAG